MTPIIFDYKGQRYELTFTRKTAKTLMSNGLTLESITNNPLEAVPRLFSGAFNANHARVPLNQREEMFELIGDKEELLSALYELFVEPIGELMDEPKDESVKINWGRGE